MRFEVELEGLDKVLSSLDELAKEEIIAQALGKACALVERTAKEKAPKDTGALRRSITSEVRGNHGIVFTPLEYAPYVEFGTGLFAEGGDGRKDVPWRYQDDEGNWWETIGQRPQPFMRPALYENKNKILEILRRELLK